MTIHYELNLQGILNDLKFIAKGTTITNNMYRNLVDYPPLVQDEGLKLVIRETNQMIRVQS